jgi:xanthine dehydrogenase accessory factor
MKIFERICEVLREDNGAVLATIVDVSGSTPAPGQSKMLIRSMRDYSAIGTVGGGCLDQYIMLSLNDGKFTGAARVLTYHLNDDDSDTGLTCGGTVHVMVESITAEMEPLFLMLRQRRKDARGSYLLTGLGQISAKSLLDEDGRIICGAPAAPVLLEQIHTLVSRKQRPEGSRRLQSEGAECVLEYIEPPVRVIVFGGGHVGRIALKCGALAGFSMTIVDDREHYANRERFPEADAVVCQGFEDAMDSLKITNDDFIVIVTRGHKYDEQILEKIVPLHPRYIGMIGSKRKVALSYERLRARGISQVDLDSVHAPIGLDIGAETAEEIGVSIVAELVAVRRGIRE